ncbi:hypothetical protein FGADI_12211 [Fusarium gaditjirri]|uniref:Uncharacterized protein n=1 Tax=Fusarium gaditjirri TaxID=282569 RepID=A0A8H4WP23_9HYPO|nr:hypothetical protein FGADI_12211 [Fusarium gaditjirri]
MRLNTVVLVALNIIPILAKYTTQPEPLIQCPNLLPNQHVSQLHCKIADGNLIPVDGPGPFDCETSYIAVRPQTSTGSKEEPAEITSNEPAHCDVRLIQFTNDGLVRDACCKDGIAVFATQDQESFIVRPGEPSDGMQKPIQRLQTDDHMVDKKEIETDEETKDEDGDEDEGDYDEVYEEEDDGYDDEDLDSDEDDEEGEEYDDFDDDTDVEDIDAEDIGEEVTSS